jgi:hypothetical protein
MVMLYMQYNPPVQIPEKYPWPSDLFFDIQFCQLATTKGSSFWHQPMKLNTVHVVVAVCGTDTHTINMLCDCDRLARISLSLHQMELLSRMHSTDWSFIAQG